MESLVHQTKNKLFIVIFLITLSGFILYLLTPILIPFSMGALLAYLVNPVVNQLTRFKIPRTLSVVIVFLVLFFLIVLLILLLIPLIQNQIQNLVNFIPSIFVWLQDVIKPWVIAHAGAQDALNIEMLKQTLAENWTKAGGVLTWAWKAVLKSGFTVAEWLFNLVLIPVVIFYLLRDWNKVVKNCHDILPRSMEPTVTQLVKQSDNVLSAFFRGQLLVMISLGIIYSVGLSIIGLQIGVLIGLIAGLLSIVPYLGLIVGLISASIAAFMQFGTITSVLAVLIVFAIGQTVESMFLTPKLVGHRIGLHPVAVIFAVLTGGCLFGFFGVLLALPVAAVVMVWLRFLNQRYRESRLYNEKA